MVREHLSMGLLWIAACAMAMGCGGSQAQSKSSSSSGRTNAASVKARMQARTAGGAGAGSARSGSMSPKARSGLRQRADCAHLELAALTGDKVPADKLAACQGASRPRPAPVQRVSITSTKPKAEPAAPPQILADVEPPPSRPPLKSKPDWVDRFPRKAGMLYGVGHGKDLPGGFRSSVVMIAAQLQVHINSTRQDMQSQDAVEKRKDGELTGTKTTYREYVSESTQMLVKGAVDDVKLEDQWVDGKAGTTWVLSSLDLAALRAREDALVNSVLAILARATERLVGSMSQDKVLDQRALLELVSVLDEVQTIGRSKLGKKVRDRWKVEFRRFRDLMERTLDCVEAKSTVVSESKTGSERKVSLSCRGLPLVHAAMAPSVDGGLTRLPGALATDATGSFSLSLGEVYGDREVQLGFVHDLGSIAGISWLRRLTPSARAKVKVTATHPARVGVKVSGVKGAEKKKLVDAFKAFLARKWGAKATKPGKGLLDATVHVELGSPTSVSNNFSQAVEVSVAVVGKKGGKVYEKTVRSGAVAETEAKARETAVTNMARAMNRW